MELYTTHSWGAGGALKWNSIREWGGFLFIIIKKNGKKELCHVNHMKTRREMLIPLFDKVKVRD